MKRTSQWLMAGIIAASSVCNLNAFNPRQEGKIIHSLVTSVGRGYLWTDAGAFAKDQLDDENFPIMDGCARANIRLGDSFSAQFDLEGLLAINERNENDGEDYLQHYYYTCGHFTWRCPGKGVVGILGGYGESCGGADEEAQTWLAGGEGIANLGDITLYGQGGYMRSDDENEDDVFTNAWWARGVVRAPIGHSAKVELEGCYASGRGPDSGSADQHGFQWAARVDRVIRNGPVSFYLKYFGSRHKTDVPGGHHLTDHVIEAGLSMALGAKDYRDEEERGVCLSSPAHAFGHWTAWSLHVTQED